MEPFGLGAGFCLSGISGVRVTVMAHFRLGVSRLRLCLRQRQRSRSSAPRGPLISLPDRQVTLIEALKRIDRVGEGAIADRRSGTGSPTVTAIRDQHPRLPNLESGSAHSRRRAERFISFAGTKELPLSVQPTSLKFVE